MDLHEVALSVILVASVLTLFLVVAKALAKEFEDTAVVWIRVFKRIRAELHAPVKKRGIKANSHSEPTALKN